MMSLFDIVQRWVSEPPPDHLFEITENGLAGVSTRTPVQIRQQVLVERSLAASPSAPNLIKPHLYREALMHVCGKAAGGRGNSRVGAALVIPDYAVRMAILDFEQFPAGEEERNALIRFRLRKSVPFHIDEAQVSHSVQVREPGHIEVLAVAIARSILNEYEAVLADAGFRVGLVMPSAIAALPLCSGPEDGLRLVAKAAGSTVTVLLIEHGRMRLVRCLDLASGASGDEEHVHEEQVEEGNFNVLALLQQTLAYAEDQIGQPAKRLVLVGFGGATEALGKVAQQEFGLSYTGVRSKFGAATEHNAGLLGLLEQYAA